MTEAEDPYEELETSFRDRFFAQPESSAWGGGPWDVFDLPAYAQRGPVPQLLHTILSDAQTRGARAIRFFLEPLRVDIHVQGQWTEAVIPPQNLWWLFEMILKVLANIPPGRIEIDCSGSFSVSLDGETTQSYRTHFLNIVAPATIVLIPHSDAAAVQEVAELLALVAEQEEDHHRWTMLEELAERVRSHYGVDAPELENIYRRLAFIAERSGKPDAEIWHERADTVRDFYVR